MLPGNALVKIEGSCCSLHLGDASGYRGALYNIKQHRLCLLLHAAESRHLNFWKCSSISPMPAGQGVHGRGGGACFKMELLSSTARRSSICCVRSGRFVQLHFQMSCGTCCDRVAQLCLRLEPFRLGFMDGASRWLLARQRNPLAFAAAFYCFVPPAGTVLRNGACNWYYSDLALWSDLYPVVSAS